jgi:hypothetical protein
MEDSTNPMREDVEGEVTTENISQAQENQNATRTAEAALAVPSSL